MVKSWFRSFGSRRAVAPALFIVVLVAGASARAQAPSPARALWDRALAAEAAYRFDVAIGLLYELVLEHPRAVEARDGRLTLARLLTLSGELPAAILQCQALRNETPEAAARQVALNLATTLSRRLRAGTAAAPFYSAVDVLAPRGLAALDEPLQIEMEATGTFLLVDPGARRVYRVGPESATPLAGVGDPAAIAVLPEGSVLMAERTGIMSVAVKPPAPFTGTWGGRTRPLKNVRALASTSRGDLFVIDRDFEGLLRCRAGGAACVPWGPPGKLRAVKVGLSDFVYLLDDRQSLVRVLNGEGKPLATFGPSIGSVKLENVVDIAVDVAHGVYLLDADLRRVEIGALRMETDGRMSVRPVGSVTVPAEGDRSLRNPSAIGVTASGALIVAGRSSPRLLRFQ
jgi:hypothetical protein